MSVILFDIDGTLINTGGAGGTALLEAFRVEFGVREPGPVSFSGRTDRGIAGELFGLHGIDPTEANWERLRDGYLDRLEEYLPRHTGRVLPGVVSLLEMLAERSDIAVGLLTGNVRRGARLKLQHFALHQHFWDAQDAVLGGFGDHHPDRDDVAHEALRATRSHLAREVPAEQVWVIGDTPMDIRCARAIGAKVLAVATGLHPRGELERLAPDLLLDDLQRPHPLLATFERALG